MRVRKGDTVQVLKGKDARRTGRVLKALHGRRKVIVEGVNIYKKHLKGDGRTKQSGIIDLAKPLDVSNIMVVCQECGKPTRVGYEIKGKKKTRICKRCGKNPAGKPVAETEKKETKKKPTKKAPSKRKSTTKKDSKK